MKQPKVEAGFDYAKAMLRLTRRFSYSEIAEYCGYDSKSSVSAIIAGTLPTHPQGEALYILYTETFHVKPENVQYIEQQTT